MGGPTFYISVNGEGREGGSNAKAISILAQSFTLSYISANRKGGFIMVILVFIVIMVFMVIMVIMIIMVIMAIIIIMFTMVIMVVSILTRR